MIEDFFGQELNVGDSVITGTTTNNARGFVCGTIKEFTLKKVRIDVIPKRAWRSDNTTLVYPDQLMKVNSELFTLKLLKGELS